MILNRWTVSKNGMEKLNLIIGLIEMEERLLKEVLTNENPLVILPSLAKKIGFRETLIYNRFIIG